MIGNTREVLRVKRKHERDNPLTLEEKYKLLNAMYEEVRQLNRFTSRTARDRKHKISVARILNAGV